VKEDKKGGEEGPKEREEVLKNGKWQGKESKKKKSSS